jgi:hypothetical protein
MGSGEFEDIWQWVIILGATAGALILSDWSRLNESQERAVAYSAALFVTLLVVLRPAWKLAQFWKRMAAVFVAHSVVVVCLLKLSVPESARLRGIPAILAVLVEATLIIRFLRRAVGGSMRKRL